MISGQSSINDQFSTYLYDIVESNFPNGEYDLPRLADGNHSQPTQGRDERRDVRTGPVPLEGAPRNAHVCPPAGHDGEGVPVGRILPFARGSSKAFVRV